MDERQSDTEGGEETVAAAAVPFEPNVKLAGEAEPLGPGPITVGMETLDPLPGAATQRAGFYYKKADLLIQMYPQFKRITAKGE